VSDAAAQPEFDPDGAPISVLVDFDGTISLADVGDALLGDLVADQALVRSMDQQYIDGRMGSRELIAWDMEVLPRDAAVLLAAVDAVPLDETMVDLVGTVRDLGAAIEIVSDGMGFHIERMLARLAVPDIPVATNRSTLGEGADGVTFPYGHQRCHVCGTCKRERIRTHQAAGRVAVFVGDGPSDRYAAHHADILFAKDSLAVWCQSEDIAYEPWERLSDVAGWLESAIADGRLPGDALAFEAWVTGRRMRLENGPPRPDFICGPEVWGDGRAVAVLEGARPS
jgi:2,3-diketo-5-methylthio-1-phosphopentane phosphatase